MLRTLMTALKAGRRTVSAGLAIGVLAGASASASAVSLADGLVAHYPFDDGAGLTADETTGLSADGNLNNFPGDNSQWVPGQIGGALEFRGPTDQDYVIAPNYTMPTTSATFAGWVFADTGAVAWESIIKNWGGGVSGQFHFGLDDTTGKLGLFVKQSGGGVVGPIEDTNVLPTGQWVHTAFVASADLGTATVYVDGNPVASLGYDGTLFASSIASLGIGVKTDDAGTAPNGGSPGFWDGKFDDFGLWNRALSSDEIGLLHSAGLNGVGIAQLSAAVPEPASAALGLLGLAALGLGYRRRR